MTNEMKLLTALINELGFDVERVCVNQKDIESQEKRFRESFKVEACKWWQFPPERPVYIYNIDPICEYKLTKKEEAVVLPVEGDFWGAIVKYIVAHHDDIESKINDYGDLKPVLDYFNRNS